MITLYLSNTAKYKNKITLRSFAYQGCYKAIIFLKTIEIYQINWYVCIEFLIGFIDRNTRYYGINQELYRIGAVRRAATLWDRDLRQNVSRKPWRCIIQSYALRQFSGNQ